jgi:hypothetical protein
MGGQATIGSARLIIYPKDILSVEGGRFERWRLGSLNLPRDGAALPDSPHGFGQYTTLRPTPSLWRQWDLLIPIGPTCIGR